MDRIRILQIGGINWGKRFRFPENVKLIYAAEELELKKEIYEIVVLERNITQEEYAAADSMSMAYCFFIVDSFEVDELTRSLFDRKMGKMIPENGIQNFLDNEAKKYFPKPYGEKFRPEALGIAQSFSGRIKWNGQYSVSLEGDYGNTLNQVVFWRGNIPIEANQAIEFWLEYKKTDGIEITLAIKQFVSGSLSDICDSWEFTEEELKQPVIIEGRNGQGTLFCELKAKGYGKLDVIALHDRISRWGIGTFMVGGERFVTSEREEIFAYFDPGDMKPPLSVYFSGYKTMEGFEGYYMMKKMGCPFLLISEQRFQGGGFYLGSKEYERLMVSVIERYMNKLGFYSNQLILSGISMGTIGSMYYGCDLRPHALILGKPLASLGDIAANERLRRPGGFPTSLDLLQYHGGGMDGEAIFRLNERFWNKLRATDFSHTKFIVSYMYEDDYDDTAYNKILTILQSFGVQVYGKGLHGRHNDNTSGIGAWFKGQYERVLHEDYER
ncbi:accessory Sec system protein Asp2 [Pseudobutyrivibrio xylanivorans]|uniref:Accessory Sec system protein Asp2 n=1 Tax=Pseudobutyrivibrio xylanivorans TaxID=185007 RepID=A0A5P6VTB5_PSEXY|nr:accessory Sec system protein Asp2 [Pseudobutyrivibrio xylanivorans]QFJ55876.1 accessory Sec system protein Asp2 [Pseudobutyrivibrio xylanivorans]